MIGPRQRLVAAAAAIALLAGCGGPVPGQVTQAAPPVTSPVATSGRVLPVAPLAVRSGPSAPGPRITSVANFRDVAGDGPGLKLTDGTRMAVGVVYRSARLKPISAADKRRLEKAGITDIYDLRTPAVVKKAPDPAIKGATWHASNIFAVKATAAVKPASVAKAKAHMKSVNRRFVSDPAQRKAIGRVLRGIAGDRGPVLVHCTEGKDRTGWISAILQLTAGASEKTVIGEYLLSNSYRKALIEQDVAKAKRSGGAKAAAIKRALVQVDASYLKAGLSELKKRYGSLNRYLTKGLGLSTSTVMSLRTQLRAG